MGLFFVLSAVFFDRCVLKELFSAGLAGLRLPIVTFTGAETEDKKGKNERKKFHYRDWLRQDWINDNHLSSRA